MAYGTATLTGTYKTFDDQPAEGVVEIIPNSRSLVDAEGDVILAGRVKVTLDEAGSFSVALPATDDETVEPATGRQYTVVAKLRHTHLAAITGVELAAGATVDVADLAAQPATDALVTNAATTAQLAALQFGTVSATTPEAHGAVGDGTADDTAAVQAALDAVPTVGGIVYLAGRYYCPTGVTVNTRARIMGAGQGDMLTLNGPSAIITDSTTATGITVAANGTALEDFAVINTAATPTAGAGVKMTEGNGVNLTRVLVSGFYDNVEWADGFYWNMTDCTILDPVRYGVFHHNTSPNYDWGDGSIKGGIIAGLNKNRNFTAGIRWESGGGLKVTGVKLNGALNGTDGTTPASKYQFGIDARVADGISTSVLVVSGCSIENCTSGGALIKVAHKGPSNTGVFSKIAITGNELAITSGSPGIAIEGAVASKLGGVAITGNVIADCGTAIYLGNVDDVTVGNNTFRNYTSAHYILSGVTNLVVGPQAYTGTNKRILFDNTVGAASHGPFGSCTWDLQREVPTTTSSTTYTNLYKFTMGGDTAGILDVTLAGNVVGVGPYMVQARRSFTRTGSGAVALTAIGADVTAGAAVDVDFDTSTTTGVVFVRVRRNGAGGGTDVAGRCRVLVTGPIYDIHKS